MNRARVLPSMMAVSAFMVMTGCGGARSATRYTAGPDADFRNAVNAEVRNAQDQVVLSGTFVEADSGDEDIERKAMLTATPLDPDAFGEVEVESCRDAGCRSQEVEFSVANVQPGAVFRLVIGGKEFATVTTDNRGRANVERDVPLQR
jgi:hypothetical protein